MIITMILALATLSACATTPPPQSKWVSESNQEIGFAKMRLRAENNSLLTLSYGCNVDIEGCEFSIISSEKFCDDGQDYSIDMTARNREGATSTELSLARCMKQETLIISPDSYQWIGQMITNGDEMPYFSVTISAGSDAEVSAIFNLFGGNRAISGIVHEWMRIEQMHDGL